MRTLRTVAELREALAPARREGRTIGLVPTMGALHEGHLALLRAAREQCDVVVMSLFVNPSQFDEAADLQRYPRDEARDARLAQEAGVDLLFAPEAGEVYPPAFATSVSVAGLSEPFEGRVRGAVHFQGVATVVTKLLCMVAPDVAYFGRKDAQQLLVIRRLAADLNLPVRIEGLATVREPDGLALSSRNALLSAEERARALGLPAALRRACELADEGERSAAVLLGAVGEVLASFGLEPEYAALVDPETLAPVHELDSAAGGEALLLAAVRVGGVRLIDNTTIGLTPAESIHMDGVATALA
jgi:pantoate--beta-alanine ligase